MKTEEKQENHTGMEAVKNKVRSLLSAFEHDDPAKTKTVVVASDPTLKQTTPKSKSFQEIFSDTIRKLPSRNGVNDKTQKIVCKTKNKVLDSIMIDTIKKEPRAPDLTTNGTINLKHTISSDIKEANTITCNGIAAETIGMLTDPSIALNGTKSITSSATKFKVKKEPKGLKTKSPKTARPLRQTPQRVQSNEQKPRKRRKKQLIESNGDKANVSVNASMSSHHNGRLNQVRITINGVKIKVDHSILARWSDGRFYMGTIVKADVIKEKCLVQFEDDSRYWALFKDLKEAPPKGEIHCNSCFSVTSDKPNEIVLCDKCGIGYHQHCHNPPIEDDVLQPDAEWICRQCIFRKYKQLDTPLKIDTTVANQHAVAKSSFPYDNKLLSWDANHKVNKQQTYCYCGGPGDWFMKMLQCCRCKQWFHEACIQCLEYPLLCGDRYYIFVCTVCNKGPEYIQKLSINWINLTQLCLFNLTVVKGKKYYDVDEIVSWIETHRDKFIIKDESDTTKPEPALAPKILEILLYHTNRFKSGMEIRKKRSIFGLRLRVPPPVPKIILPAVGQITKEVMSNLHIVGKKTKTFIPAQSLSPVTIPPKRGSQGRGRGRKRKQQVDDHVANGDLHPKKKRLLDIRQVNGTSSVNQDYKGYSGNFDVYDFHDDSSLPKAVPSDPWISDLKPPTLSPPKFTPGSPGSKSPTKKTRKPKVKVPLLERLIPIPTTFEKHLNPFMTISEQKMESEKRRLLYEYIDDMTPGVDASLQEEPPVLEKMTDVPKKRGRKPIKRDTGSDIPQLQKALSEQNNNYTKLRNNNIATVRVSDHKKISRSSSGTNPLNPKKKLKEPEAFKIFGQRQSANGQLQYFIHWKDDFLPKI
ncbi:unnamed protein product [Owenia fusiformis]|uniref:PHD-type domain-containing protein n=1 Tax=Owenia fusiformis TaxID=6347 RepID=A0A8S4P3K7_OWEFU|nr:unnamed protein product [Owenia fusiformis]